MRCWPTGWSKDKHTSMELVVERLGTRVDGRIAKIQGAPFLISKLERRYLHGMARGLGGPAGSMFGAPLVLYNSTDASCDGLRRSLGVRLG